MLQQKHIQESEYFTQELSLDIKYSSRFVQYPHYPIACCLPHLSKVAHNCHSKKKNLTTKRNRLKAKRKPHGKKTKTHGKISLIPRGHFNSYFFCHEVVVILFAVRLFFLARGFVFAVRLILLPWQLWATISLKFCSWRFLIFQHVGIREN